VARILVLVAHPDLERSHVNRALLDAARAAAEDGAVEVVDLYAHYPDYLIDLGVERARLREVRLLVWVHPIHWYGMPPLLKLWIDEVFAFGWAYGPGGDALRGRDLWLVTSTGGPEESYRRGGYNRYPFDAFLPPFEQTAALVGMRFLPPLVLYGAHRAGAAEVADHAAVFGTRLRSYPDWPEIDALPECVACEVPADARRLAE
jgi:glutathione-regulated potassium-efflux system ancillary protein KefF